MTVTLYLPTRQPTAVVGGGFSIPEVGSFVTVSPQTATLLGCSPELVDVLASGPGYVVYTIFDSEGKANPAATQAMAALAGIDFDTTSEDELLRGPVLIVKE